MHTNDRNEINSMNEFLAKKFLGETQKKFTRLESEVSWNILLRKIVADRVDM